MKPLVLAIALALVAPLPVLAQAAPATAAAAAAGPAWVTRSNDFAQILLQAQAPFQPEEVSFFGVPGYDDKVTDLGPDNARRYRDAIGKARRVLQEKLEIERDPNVRQDLAIMIHAADQAAEGSALNERLLLPWQDAPQMLRYPHVFKREPASDRARFLAGCVTALSSSRSVPWASCG
jgi:hypothetical protein